MRCSARFISRTWLPIVTQAEVSGYPSSRQKTGFFGVKRHWQVHRVVTPAAVGSSPTAPAIFYLRHSYLCEECHRITSFSNVNVYCGVLLYEGFVYTQEYHIDY